MEEGIVCGRDRAAQARLTGPLPLPAREMAGLLQKVFRQPHFVVLRTPELDVGPRLDPGRDQLRLHRECDRLSRSSLSSEGAASSSTSTMSQIAGSPPESVPYFASTPRTPSGRRPR